MKSKLCDGQGFVFEREEGGKPFAMTFFHNDKEYLIQVKDAEELPDSMSDEQLFDKVAAKETEWTK
jgi:hypothetical protein